jgi:hypothetical protein
MYQHETNSDRISCASDGFEQSLYLNQCRRLAGCEAPDSLLMSVAYSLLC